MELFGVAVTYTQAGVLAAMAVTSYVVARVRARKARDDYYIKMIQERDRAMKDRPRTQKLIRETLQYENVDPETGMSLKRHELNKRMASLREQHASQLKSIRDGLESGAKTLEETKNKHRAARRSLRSGDRLLKDLKGQEEKLTETRRGLKETLESVDRMINERVLAQEGRSMSTVQAFSAYEVVLQREGDAERATRTVEEILGQAERIVNERLLPEGTEPVDLVGVVSVYRESHEEWVQAARAVEEYRAEVGEISTSIDGVREEMTRLRGEARPQLADLYEQSRRELDNEYFRGISRESLERESLRGLLGNDSERRRQINPGRRSREDRSQER